MELKMMWFGTTRKKKQKTQKSRSTTSSRQTAKARTTSSWAQPSFQTNGSFQSHPGSFQNQQIIYSQWSTLFVFCLFIYRYLFTQSFQFSIIYLGNLEKLYFVARKYSVIRRTPIFEQILNKQAYFLVKNGASYKWINTVNCLEKLSFFGCWKSLSAASKCRKTHPCNYRIPKFSGGAFP